MSEDCHTCIGDPGYPKPPEGLAGRCSITAGEVARCFREHGFESGVVGCDPSDDLAIEPFKELPKK